MVRDLVTPAWWDDIWLNESFAEWMGSKISDQWRPQLGIAQEQLDSTLGAMDTDALRAGRPIHQPVTRNSQISSTFDGITYEKGAGVIRMVESYLGEERFQRGVRLHLTRRAYGTATAAEFFAAMAEASGERGVIDAFESFVNQPGVPLIAVSAAPDGSLNARPVALPAARPCGGRAGRALEDPVLRANLYVAAQPRKSCTMLTDDAGTLAVLDLRGAIVHPNADGAGYYRFTVETALWQSLLSMSARLPPREAMTLADSTGAAFNAGRLPFSGLFHAAQVLSNHPDRTTALSLGYQLATLDARMATPAERVLLERALVNLYGERLSKLGYDATPGRYASEAAEQQLLRRQLIDLVGLTGRDPGVRAALTPFAERSVVDPAAVESLLRGRIWAIGVQERGAPILESLKKLATSSPDAQVRADAGFALGYAEGPVANRALALTLEPAFDVEFAARVIFAQMANPRTREAARQWLGAHEEAAIGRVPAMFQSLYAGVGDSFPAAPRSERRSIPCSAGGCAR